MSDLHEAAARLAGQQRRMTRDEAVAKLQGFDFTRLPDTSLVDALVALGVLRLAEPFNRIKGGILGEQWSGGEVEKAAIARVVDALLRSTYVDVVPHADAKISHSGFLTSTSVNVLVRALASCGYEITKRRP